jgi:hypothetical protein
LLRSKGLLEKKHKDIASRRIHIYLTNQKLRQQRNAINVIHVKKLSFKVLLLFNIKELILERNPTYVKNVAKPSAIVHPFLSI